MPEHERVWWNHYVLQLSFATEAELELMKHAIRRSGMVNASDTDKGPMANCQVVKSLTISAEL